jgi:hypothetical protein
MRSLKTPWRSCSLAGVRTNQRRRIHRVEILDPSKRAAPFPVIDTGTADGDAELGVRINDRELGRALSAQHNWSSKLEVSSVKIPGLQSMRGVHGSGTRWG